MNSFSSSSSSLVLKLVGADAAVPTYPRRGQPWTAFSKRLLGLLTGVLPPEGGKLLGRGSPQNVVESFVCFKRCRLALMLLELYQEEL